MGERLAHITLKNRSGRDHRAAPVHRNWVLPSRDSRLRTLVVSKMKQHENNWGSD